jgi:hypothetical protein
VTSEKHYYHESISSQSKEPDSIKEFQKALEQYEQKEEILFRHRNKQWKSDKNTIRELGKYVNECLEKRLQRRMTTRSMTRLQEQDDVLTPEERGIVSRPFLDFRITGGLSADLFFRERRVLHATRYGCPGSRKKASKGIDHLRKRYCD